MLKVFRNAAEEEITGAVGSVETGFTTAAVTLRSGMLRDGDRVCIRTHFECTGKGTAPSYNPNVRVGGIGGVKLGNLTGVVHASGQSEWTEHWLTYRTTGASPAWHFRSSLTSEANATFDGPNADTEKTTPPTNADIVILPTVLFTATANASDKIKLRDLTVEIYRA